MMNIQSLEYEGKTADVHTQAIPWGNFPRKIIYYPFRPLMILNVENETYVEIMHVLKLSLHETVGRWYNLSIYKM